ncbi:unnamed protein product, partial [Discosporangium mesarthrocarpum]
ELIHVNPPKLEDYSSEEDSGGSEDDDARPLTREELKAKTLTRIQRKTAREAPRSGKGRVTSSSSSAAAATTTGTGGG